MGTDSPISRRPPPNSRPAADGFVALLARACSGRGSLREHPLRALRCSGTLLPGSVMVLAPPLSRYRVGQTFSKTVMGITIHYEGRLRSEHELELVLTLIRNTARSEGWPYEDVCESVGVLERVVDDEERDYAGQVRGVVAHPHEDSEPLRFLFGDDLFLQDYCKTQFSSPDLHVAIVTLFRALLPHFDELRVEDEGEFWDTDDVERLRELWDDFDAALALALEANPCAKVKVRLPSGRIIDMLE